MLLELTILIFFPTYLFHKQKHSANGITVRSNIMLKRYIYVGTLSLHKKM